MCQMEGDIPVGPQCIGIAVRPDEPIPQVGTIIDSQFIAQRKFIGKPLQPKIFVLILMGRQSFISEEQWINQQKLIESLNDFSEAIGANALGIWFVDDSGEHPDFNRGEYYCEIFGIGGILKKAPHIVIIEKHPDDWNKGDKIGYISLNRIQPDRLHILLAEAAEYIREGKIPLYKSKIRVAYEALKKWFDDHIEEWQILASFKSGI